MKILDELKPGDKLYYPSIKGAALICEYIGDSEDDILVDISGIKFFIPKKNVNTHAIALDANRSKLYVSQRLEDPENKIIYLKCRWNETIPDKLYNYYCQLMGRSNKPAAIPDESNKAEVLNYPSSH